MRRLRFWLLVGSLVLLAAPAHAEFPQGIPETFRLRLGLFIADLETEVGAARIGSPLGGLEFSYERDLNLDDSDEAFRLDGTFKLGSHFGIDFGYVEFDRENETRIVRSIEFEEFIFAAGAEVHGRFQSTNIYGAFRWDIFSHPSWQLGISLGVDWFDLTSELSATAGVTGPGGPVVGGVTRESSVSVPAPVIGAQAAFAVWRTVTLGGYIRYIGLDVDEAEGSLTDAAVRADWFIWRNFGVGLSYDWSLLDLDRLESGDFEYTFKYEYSGPRLFLIVTF
jgi:hypothetical protein